MRWGMVLAVTLALAGCGGNTATTASTANLSNRNAAGVRASYYEYFHDESTDNAEAACALSTSSDQAHIAAKAKAATCEAALFKNWNIRPGVLSSAAEKKIQEKTTKETVAEVAKYKILVVGNHATVINPLIETTDELIYQNGHWLTDKHTSNTAETAEGLKKEAEETEAKTKAATEAGEARGNENALKEPSTSAQGNEGQSFSGNGGKSLGTITVEQESNLEWTNDGNFFAIYDNEGVPVNSQAQSGTTVLEVGTYKQFQVNALGNWTIRIVPK